ncbi:ATP-binding protein [Robiginitalea sp. IMCC43444]|uniref:ATP-binding protein n=1 Tax=Robiginitalea sp. IMCC43444 TaxID=3459121 RepID=UPI004042C63A
MPLKSKDLLDQIEDLQLALEHFSFANMKSEEAMQLKSTFQDFRKRLEDQIWKPEGRLPSPATESDSPNSESKNESALLIATVSHEMRTPLNGIIGFTELLEEANLGKGQQEYVNAIRSASQSLLEIVNDLLEYSKLSAGLDKINSIAFEPLRLINEVGYLCRTLIVESDVHLEIQLESDFPRVLKGDPSKLSQILINLLGNAIKYVKKGRITLRVSHKIRGQQCEMHFCIEDTGVGIASEELPYIFNIYHQGKQPISSNRKGLGLGLSIVKKLIEQQDGKVSVKSRPGIGTTFKLAIPYSIVHTEVKATPEEKTLPKKELEGLRVFVFEDNPLNQKLIETRLKSWGCQVTSTDRVEYGLGLLKKLETDIILMDLRMPGMDGYQASAQIRTHQNRNIRKIPIIAVTADFTAEDNRQFTESGIDDVILKPYSPDELFSKLKFYSTKSNSEATATEPTRPDRSTEITGHSRDIDLSNLLDECSGDLDMLEELLGLFDNNILEFLGKVKLFLETSDYKGIAGAAHKVKAGLKLVEAEKLVELTETMHQLAKTGTGLHEIRRAFEMFINEYPLFHEEIKTAFQHLKDSE